MKIIKTHNLIQRCRKVLKRHPQFDCYPHFSFIVRNNEVLGFGTNVSHEPPIHYGYHNLRDGDTFKPKFHSEIRAYLKSKRRIGTKSFSIINIRMNKQGEIKKARPCKTCFALLKNLGCELFVFSDNNKFSFLET